MKTRPLLAALLLAAGCPARAFDSVVAFNELNYHPASAASGGEWLELHNQQGVDVDLSGWSLTSGVDYRFPEGTVIPGKGYLVVAANPSARPGALGPWTGQLSNGGETVRLRDNNDRLMDEISYGDGGDWPLAPDGSGATLCKRQEDLSSETSEAWTFSPQQGGSPGALNFPPPAAPRTLTAVDLRSFWHYLNTGSDPGPTWKTIGFPDQVAPWQIGQACFGFGPSQVYQPGTPLLSSGVWDQKSWTSDGDSGLAESGTYTHKIALNRPTSVLAINGLTFDSPGSEVRSGPTWSLSGADASFINNGSGSGANNLPASSGSRDLCTEFFYGASDNGQSRLTLSGLTPGQAYQARFYAVGFGAAGDRLIALTPSDTGTPFLCDENAPGSGNGHVLSYRYTAPSSGAITFAFLPVIAGSTWHHYAFSNQTAARAPQEREIVGVQAAAFSSQLTASNRPATATVDGSGLSSGQHGISPSGTMWLTTGTIASPSDPLPAEITWDLGANVDLSSLHLWNYNEAASGLTSRGSRLVEILTAATPGGPFTSQGTFTLFKASGRITEPGQHLALPVPNVRQVKCLISANHGASSQLVGLSEIKFYQEGGAGTTTPLPYRETIATLYNTGTAPDRSPLPAGAPDPHYANPADPAPLLAMAPNAAWLANDSASRFISPASSGNDSVPAGTFTYRTTADFTDYDPATAQIRVSFAADNSLDLVKLNGATVTGLSGAGFASYLGPFTLPGPFLPGPNQFDFQWTNAGTTPNPGGLRLRWDATAAARFTRTTLAANPPTTWFRQSFTLNSIPGSTWTGSLTHALNDGAIFYLNGIECHRVNLSGTPSASSLADAPVPYPFFSNPIPIPSGFLQEGENILAVELHQAAPNSPDALFGCSLVATSTPPSLTANALKLDKIASALATAFGLDLRNFSPNPLNLSGYHLLSSSGAAYSLTGSLAPGAWLSLSDAALGFRPLDGAKLFLLGPGDAILDAAIVKNRPQARTPSGTWQTPLAHQPGAPATFAVPDSIVINEIMYQHAPRFLPSGSTPNPEEWIELYNRSAAPVDLSGWQLRGGIAFDFAATTLPPGGFLVIAQDPAALAAKFPAISVLGPFSGTLSNRGDRLRLLDPNGNTADEVAYQTSGRWDQRADGRGSSLELRHPNADNALPESWAASDEGHQSTWQSFSWTGTGAAFPGTNNPTLYNELILGLLNDGTCLVDDLSVKEVSAGNRELIQNGSFSSGTADTWRLLGNHGIHGRSLVVDDPSSPGNKVLEIAATGATEHMHNHCETTLKAGSTFVTLNASSTYTISFRARWVSGCPRLNARLYFNRLARTVLLPMPENTGTPGAPNSRWIPNPGPSLSLLQHLPAVPAADTPVTVSLRAADPDGMGPVNLRWRRDGASLWNTIPLSGGPTYAALLPGQPAGTLVEFYIEASDAAATAATARFPAASALVKWDDGSAPLTPGHRFRLLMTTANANLMHEPSNVMSNDSLPATVIYRDSEVFYQARCRLKSSERGRLADIRLGFAVDFDPLQPFRGKQLTVNLDRSSYGRGTTGSGYGQSDLFNWHFFNKAGGVPSMYNDLVYLVSPRPAHTGSAQLTMAEFNDPYLDGQWDHGGATPTFKYELIYYPTTTVGGTREGLKIPQPDDVLPVSVGQIGTGTNIAFPPLSLPDKEPYRWNFLIQNARSDDDYSRIIDLNTVFRQTGPTYLANLPKIIDVDQWLRTFAALSLAGIGDHYSTAGGGWHNLKLYQRNDGRILMLPWDHDFVSEAYNAPVVRAPDLSKMIAANPAWHRAFYGHLLDIMARSFNPTYLRPWTTHYQTYTTTGGNWAELADYTAQRRTFVLADAATQYPKVPFAITTNSGANFTTAEASLALAGTAWVDVRSLRIQGSSEPLPLLWTSRNAWKITLPIAPGPNPFIIEALDFSGAILATDSLVITGSGTTVPASPENLVISEINYNPAPPSETESAAGFTDNNDFEFIELRNIASSPILLTGVHFSDGIQWSAPSGATLLPGASAVIPRRTAAFAKRYPNIATLPEFYQPGANQLNNRGETLTLADAVGAPIKQFAYDAAPPWPAISSTGGPTLVLVAPALNPDPSQALHWRASLSPLGSPGSTDATPPPANPNADDDRNGVPNLLQYAFGPRGALSPPTPSPDRLTAEITFPRAPGSDALATLESSPTLENWSPAPATLTQRILGPDGSETLTLRTTLPPGARRFLRLRLSTR